MERLGELEKLDLGRPASQQQPVEQRGTSSCFALPRQAKTFALQEARTHSLNPPNPFTLQACACVVWPLCHEGS